MSYGLFIWPKNIGDCLRSQDGSNHTNVLPPLFWPYNTPFWFICFSHNKHSQINDLKWTKIIVYLLPALVKVSLTPVNWEPCEFLICKINLCFVIFRVYLKINSCNIHSLLHFIETFLVCSSTQWYGNIATTGSSYSVTNLLQNDV